MWGGPNRFSFRRKTETAEGGGIPPEGGKALGGFDPLRKEKFPIGRAQNATTKQVAPDARKPRNSPSFAGP